MMIPEAWENHADMTPERKAFYRFHSCLMEPWDGPASVVFTDGTVVGAVLDRNGLRPSRYWVCDDGLVVMASEVGTLDIDQSTVVQQGPPAARARCSSSTRRRAASSTTTRSRPSWPRAPVPAVARRQPGAPRRPARGDPHHRVRARDPPRAADVRVHPRGAASSSSTRWPAPATRRSARWAPTRPLAVLSNRPRLHVRLLRAAVRPGHQPAARRHPRGAGHQRRRAWSAPRATCWTRSPRAPPDRAAPPDPRQRRARQAGARRGGRPRLPHQADLLPLPGGRGRRRPASGAGPHPPGGLRRDRRRATAC